MGPLGTPASTYAAEARTASQDVEGRILQTASTQIDAGGSEFSYRSEQRLPHLHLIPDNPAPLAGRDDTIIPFPHPEVASGGAHSRASAIAKRSIDLVGGILILLLALPMLVLIAAWIMADTRGGPIFTQRRVGQGRRTFTIYKFRTMVTDADAMITADPAIWAQYAANWKLANDPRVTRCGAILRKWSLDELPQILNVIKGEMSLVGPRPYLPHELSGEFGIHASRITSVRPGMTGLWQVSGRSNLTPHSRIHLDEVYVRNCCMSLDIRILFKTVKVVLQRNGAR